MQMLNLLMDYTISLFLDTRRAKKSGKYPVKLRVFRAKPREQKLYSIPFEFTNSEFESTWLTKKTRGDNKEMRYRLEEVEQQAKDIAKNIKPFNFTTFEKKFLNRTGDNSDIFSIYNRIVKEYYIDGRIGTGDSYNLCLKTISAFLAHEKGKEIKKLQFHEITPEWLKKYENYMTKVRGCSRTTVGIYLRTLRATFNKAISDKEISSDLYPFRKHASENTKYIIPSGRNVKKALNINDLKKFFEASSESVEQLRARDFWFFSYSCNGMNLKDIALLKYKDIKNSSFTFLRAKTIQTSKQDLKPIQVHINDFAERVIRKYGNKNKDSYVFPILKETMTEKEQHRAIKNFIKYINQHIKAFAKKIGITTDISFYYARHSFSTQVIRKGGSLEYVMQALGHSDTKTTINYFAGFENESIKDISEQLINF
ncbi:MAG: integrase [Bacteroidetes bacterium]|jgi:site-specific recombinase XerD|nr:integrase [Bacteroidota bacterium]